MVFNKDITGIENELEFVNHLNNKMIIETNFLVQNFIYKLYGEIEERSIIKCHKNNLATKTDIFITINSIEKKISIKKGIKNSVHVERISDFIHFLIENNISRDSIVEYLKYQYADGTTNGKGETRISGEDYKKIHQKELDKINKELANPILIKKAINRFVTQGTNSNYEIDAIIYGVIDDFIWITKEDIYKVILKIKIFIQLESILDRYMYNPWIDV